MAATGPALKPDEAKGVIDFIIKRAKQTQQRNLTISIEELKPFLIGANKEEDYANRIRWKMRDHFRKEKIKFKFNGDSYDFELDPIISISQKQDINSLSTNQKPPINTSTNYDEEYMPPPWFGDLLACLKNGNRPILIGPKGSGKSRACEEAMAILGRETMRIALGEIRDITDLIGTKEIVEENGVPVTKLIGGMLTEAMQSGKGVILDEFDMQAPGILSGVNKILETGVEIVLHTEHGPVKFRPHPDSLITATANTWGYGDDSGNYAGALIQNSASWDRLHPKIPVDYDYAIEKKLISQYLPEPVVNALYAESSAMKDGIVRKIRRAIEDPNNPIDDILGLRVILWFAKSWKNLGWHKGMFYFLQDFRPENREPISKIITDHLGKDFHPSRNDYNPNEENYIPNMMKTIIDKGFGH
jgi:hypothetical protein